MNRNACPPTASWPRLSRRLLAALAGSIMTASCGGGLPFMAGEEPPKPQTSQNGVKVAVILPLTGGGAAASGLKNGAELAVAQFENANVHLLVKDDKASPEGARAAAQEAIAEGAEIILGPLFAPTVQAAGQVAKTAGKPMIAFSTDASVASRGVYLLSFMPETEVERIVDYAMSQGRRSFAALVPDDAYGNVASIAFQNAVSRRGGRIVAIESFPLDKA
ncbi:MAG: penicillin-binding protein activator, partial [Beijerinckiaceae bacterium]